MLWNRSVRLVRAVSLWAVVVGLLVITSGVASSNPLDSGNWSQVGYMSTDAGMFNGNCNLAASGCSYGPDASGDFWSPSTEIFSGQEILFITGDRQYWASGSYATVLSIVAAEGWVYSPNITWSSAGIGGTAHASVTGNILSRDSNVEDPWVTIRGGHCAHETSDVFPAANDCNLVIWGEDNYNSDPIHPVLKNVSGGVEVYVSFLVPELTTSLLVFVSDRTGDTEIYRVETDGTNLVRLTHSSGDDNEPAFSPDGSKVAFHSERDGNKEIYVVDADGTNLNRLTNNSFADYGPKFSPDGTKIAFTSFRPNAAIYIMNVDGSSEVKLTSSSVIAGRPEWSPDGIRIAFTSGDHFEHEIAVMDADGTNMVFLTDNNYLDYAPAWSPDGSQLLYFSDQAGNREIHVMDIDGSNVVNLTNHASEDEEPAWSSDGSQVFFQSNRDGNEAIFTMNADGTGVVKVEDSAGDDTQPHQAVPMLVLTDTDGDGVADVNDAFPLDPSESADTDGDGVGDNGDAFPLDASETTDTDDDGIGDNADTDDDNDGLSDGLEAVLGTNPLLEDTDGDGVPDGAELAAGTDPLDITAFLPSLAPVPLGALTALLLTLGLAGMGMRRRGR